MATTNNVYVNVKELPEIQQINNGDYLLVETPDGTSIIDFQNFIVGADNSGLTSLVESNTNAIYGVSATADSNLQSLSANVYADLKRIYYGKAQVTIETGTEGIAILSPRPGAEVGEILPEDVMVIPVNAAATKFPAYPAFVDNTDDGRGLVYIAGNFVKTDYYLQGVLPVSLNITDINALDPSKTLDNYNPQDLVDNIAGTAILNDQLNNPVAIVTSTAASTVEELGITPIYNIIVCKPY